MNTRPPLPLDAVETRELLETARVGHIAYHADGELELTPVNCQVSGDTIYIRTVDTGTLAKLAPGPERVVFLVTHFDRQSQTGWSVKVRGTIRLLDEEVEAPDVDPAPWVGYPATVLLGLAVEEMTGRRVG